jgi:hypothetical protein
MGILMNRIRQLVLHPFGMRRPPEADLESGEPALAIAYQSTLPIAAIESDNLTVPTQAVMSEATLDAHDTQPGRAIERGSKLSSDETNPRKPAGLAAALGTEPDTTGLPEPSDAPMPIFGTPNDPYAGLFPPPSPDDDDFLEWDFMPPDDPTPTDFPGVSRDAAPQPPDSLPL